MSSETPKLRGGGKARSGFYPLGEFPYDVIHRIGRLIVHRLAVGHADIRGDDFGVIFASAIGGTHLDRPLGVTDVVLDDCSWSAKTIKAKKPFEKTQVRLISGRNSPDYSFDIENPHDDISKTGEAVLKVWNHRVNQSFDKHDDLRIVVLMRDIDVMEFTIFEFEARRFVPSDYEWKMNNRNNLEGFEKGTNNHCFTWQFHGSQFTVIKNVPGSARRFRFTRKPGMIETKHILDIIGFEDKWIEILE